MNIALAYLTIYKGVSRIVLDEQVVLILSQYRHGVGDKNDFPVRSEKGIPETIHLGCFKKLIGCCRHIRHLAIENRDSLDSGSCAEGEGSHIRC